MAFARSVAVALVLTACSSTAVPTTVATTLENGDPIVVSNDGGSREGHTPRGFAGMGTGLFAGDDLNPNFPEGDGVQLFLTFELPGAALGATSAVLASIALTVVGTPFEDLGALGAEIVAYETFGPHLFDTPALSDAVPCAREGEAALRCDVTDIVRPLLTDGETAVQLRLRFAVPSDLDGRQDLALFFRSDSNTNEPGLFTLTIGR